MKKLLFILLWLQLSHGCHKGFTRKVKSRRGRLGGNRGRTRGRGGRMTQGEDYMSSCMDAKEMSNHCAFLPCHDDGDRLLPGPMPCGREFCQCGVSGRPPTPKTCSEGTVFNPKTANCDWPSNNSDCRAMQSKPNSRRARSQPPRRAGSKPNSRRARSKHPRRARPRPSRRARPRPSRTARSTPKSMSHNLHHHCHPGCHRNHRSLPRSSSESQAECKVTGEAAILVQILLQPFHQLPSTKILILILAHLDTQSLHNDTHHPPGGDESLKF